MDVHFIHQKEILLAGMSFFGDPFREAGDWSMDNEIGRLCNRFVKYRQAHRDLITNLTINSDFYEVHIYSEETEAKGFFEVFVGQQLQQIEPVPLDLSIKILPAGDFAVFNLVGEQIISDWYNDIDQILSGEGWQRGASFFFQIYDQRYKGIERIADSELSAYIPVVAMHA